MNIFRSGNWRKLIQLCSFLQCKKKGKKKKRNLDRFSFEKEKFIRFEGRMRGGGKLRKRSCVLLVSFQPRDPGLLNTRAIYKTRDDPDDELSPKLQLPSTLLRFRSNDLDIHPRIPIFSSWDEERERDWDWDWDWERLRLRLRLRKIEIKTETETEKDWD